MGFVSIKASYRFLVLGSEEALVEISVYKSISPVTCPHYKGALFYICVYKSISPVPCSRYRGGCLRLVATNASNWFLVLGIAEAVVETNVFKSISPSTGTDEA